MKRPLKLALRWPPLVAAAVALAATFVLAAPASATHGQPGKQLPHHGVETGPVTSLDFAPGYPVMRSTFNGRCSVPSDWITSWTVTGEATHLGSFTGVGSHCSRLDSATGVIVYGDGLQTFIAGNGDILNGTYSNGYAPPDGSLTDEWTIVGGTGRFAAAKGHGTESGTTDLTATPWTFTATFDGWITYDASQ